MADTKGTDPAKAEPMAPEKGAARKAAERTALLEWMRAAAEAEERALADILDERDRKYADFIQRAAEQAALEPATAEQAIVEQWDAADVDSRLDALLARLADTEARLDRQLARLDAEGG